ncbi:MAG TPA: diaminopimelate epimerase [Bacteroidia bacterium]
MKLEFTKYQGTGNDFVIIDNRQNLYNHLDVARLCHPKFGIGADGLMLLEHAEGFDFKMVYYNSDGKPSTMCGNGGRCLVDFAARKHVFNGQKTSFVAVDGPHEAIWQEGRVELLMKDVNVIESRNDAFVLNTGSPHYVVFADRVDDIEIIEAARKIRYNDEFKSVGINVNFVEIIGSNQIKVRTYERGVENETLSCGTGVTASSIAYAFKTGLNKGAVTINIETPGGQLEVRFDKGEGAKQVWLCGPATEVFKGTIEI